MLRSPCLSKLAFFRPVLITSGNSGTPMTPFSPMLLLPLLLLLLVSELFVTCGSATSLDRHNMTSVTRVSHAFSRAPKPCHPPRGCECFRWFPSDYKSDRKLLTLKCTHLQSHPVMVIPSNIEALLAHKNGLYDGHFLLNPKIQHNLKYIDLSFNNLSQLGQHPYFQAYPQLAYLSLNSDGITSLVHGAFHGLRNLRTLLLRNNSISRVEDNAFSKLRKLHRLDLSQNPLGGIRSTWFRSLFMYKLEKLELRDCNISSIEPNTFIAAIYLQDLDISNNQLTQLDSNVFKGAENLRKLNLGGNKFQVVTTSAFRVFRGLNFLVLDRNDLEELREESFSRLKVTNLSVNNLRFLRVVHARAFVNMVTLRVIQLSGNPNLKFIHPKAFEGLPNLRELYLHQNHLRYLSRNVESLISGSAPLSTRINITLYNNPLWCDCNNWWILVTIKVPSHRKTPQRINFNGKDQYRCQHSDNDPHVFFSGIPASAFPPRCAPKLVYVQKTHLVRMVGSPLHLSCLTGGVPSPTIHWKLSQGEIVYDGTVHGRTKARHGVLSIHSLRTADSGTYTCFSKNAMGIQILPYKIVVHDPQLRVKLVGAETDKLTVTWTGRERNNARFYRLAYRPAQEAGSISDFTEAADSSLFREAVKLHRGMRTYTFNHLRANQMYEVCLLHIVGAPRLDNGRHCKVLRTLRSSEVKPGITKLIRHSTVFLIIGIVGCLMVLICTLTVFYKRIYRLRWKGGYTRATQAYYSDGYDLPDGLLDRERRSNRKCGLRVHLRQFGGVTSCLDSGATRESHQHLELTPTHRPNSLKLSRDRKASEEMSEEAEEATSMMWQPEQYNSSTSLIPK